MAMVRYVTTSLRFSEEAYRELRDRASRRGTSLASLVRESVGRSALLIGVPLHGSGPLNGFRRP